MGRGYSILVWDSYGSGLVKINPKLITIGEDMYGNPCNWFSCPEFFNVDDVDMKHNLSAEFGNRFEVIF